jgi:hypothetical protein
MIMATRTRRLRWAKYVVRLRQTVCALAPKFLIKNLKERNVLKDLGLVGG